MIAEALVQVFEYIRRQLDQARDARMAALELQIEKAMAAERDMRAEYRASRLQRGRVNARLVTMSEHIETTRAQRIRLQEEDTPNLVRTLQLQLDSDRLYVSSLYRLFRVPEANHNGV